MNADERRCFDTDFTNGHEFKCAESAKETGVVRLRFDVARQRDSTCLDVEVSLLNFVLAVSSQRTGTVQKLLISVILNSLAPMKTLCRCSKSHFWFTVLAVCLVQSAARAVTFTVTPAAVNNTYAGVIALDIGGLTNGEQVIVQKYLDVNSNGVLDPGEPLVDAGKLTDGKANIIGTVTNINVPYDQNPATGAITATLSFLVPEPLQNMVGSYIFQVVSPGTNFSPVTAPFVITNAPLPQSVSGTIYSNGVAPLAGAVVVALEASGSGDKGRYLAGAVADANGHYQLALNPGSYNLIPTSPGYFTDQSLAAQVNLTSGMSATNDLVLTNGTAVISGNVHDSGNGQPVGGALMTAQGSGSLFAITLAGANGDYIAGVAPGNWKVEVETEQMVRRAYLVPQNGLQVDTSTGSVGNVVFALPRANALFYGMFTNVAGAPMTGVGMSGNDVANQFNSGGVVDANGKYCVAVLGGTNEWYCAPDNSDPALALYIVSSLPNTNLNVGQALLQNFTALPATNHITGFVRDGGSNPIININVNASATLNGINFGANAQTDGGGAYSMLVAHGNWNVNLDCGYLGSLGFNCPGSQTTNIVNADAVVNFIVSTLAVTTTSLPDGTNGVFYSQTLAASGGQPPYTWSLSPGFTNLPGGLTLTTNGVLSGTPTAVGSFGFSVRVTDSQNSTADQVVSIYFAPAPLAILTTTLPNGTNGGFYFQQMMVNGGQPPHTWYLPQGASVLPPGLGFNTNGVLSGVPTTNGLFNFQVAVFVNNPYQAATQSLSLTIAPPPLHITTVSPLPNATQGVFYSFPLSASGGQPPYSWSLAAGSASLPTGLSLSTNGVLSGTPSVSGGFSFNAQVTDTAPATNIALLSLAITNGGSGPSPVVLSGPARAGNGAFQFSFNTLAGTNYTIQYTSTLRGPWTSVLSFVGPGGPMTVIDPNATVSPRFYRVKTGP